MATKIEAFRLTGRIELENAKRSKQELRDVEKAAKDTAASFKNLKGGIGSIGSAARGAASGLSDIVGQLANISEIATAIPVVGGAIKGLVGSVVGPMKTLVDMGLEFNDVIETSQIGLEAMLGSADKAAKHIESLKKFAVKTPFEFKDLVSYSQRLQAVGVTAQDVERDLNSIGDALSKVGKIGKDDLDSVVTQLTQMRAKQKVNAEELNSIAEKGIPVYDILSKKIGVTAKELMKLGEAGRLKADGVYQLLIEGFGEFGAGSMERASKTRLGQISSFNDNLAQLAGTSTKGLHEQMTYSLNTLNQGLLAGKGSGLAGMLNNASTAVGAGFNIGLDWLFGKDMSAQLVNKAKETASNALAGVSQGIVDYTPQVIKDMSNSAISWWDAANKALGIESPSKKFKYTGEMSALGFEEGMTKGMKRAFANLKKLIEKEADFLPKLAEIAKRLGADPNHLLNVMAFETAGTFNPAQKNPTSTATGLIQFMRSTIEGRYSKKTKKREGGIGDGLTIGDVAKMSATEQLDLVYKYFKPFAGKLNSQADVYNAVAGGFRRGGDSTVVYSKEKNSKYYNANKGWDIDKDGYIRKGELAQRATNALGAGIHFDLFKQSQSTPLNVAASTLESLFNKGIGIWESIKTIISSAKNGSPSGAMASALVPSKNFTSTVNAMAASGQLLANGPINVGELERVNISAGQTVETFQQLHTTIGNIGAEIKAHTIPSFDEWLSKANGASEKARSTAENYKLAVEEDSKEAILSWENAAKGFQDIMTNALGNIDGSFKDWAKGLLMSFVQMVQQMAAAAIAAQLTKALFGNTTGGASAGGWLQSAFGAIGGIFGGGKAPTPRALGGTVHKGLAYMVGEHGPELFMPGVSGSIVPNGKLAMAGGGNQGGEMNIRNVIVFDPGHVHDAMATPGGEHVTLAHITRHASQIKQILARVI
jgi:tape measure domain-containing protein